MLSTLQVPEVVEDVTSDAIPDAIPDATPDNNDNNNEEDVNVEFANVTMLDSLSCKFCLKVLREPHMTTCGHTFCYVCLKIILMVITDCGRDVGCPQCRTAITVQPMPNHQLKEVISESIETLHPAINHLYSKLLKQAEEDFTKDERNATLFNGYFAPSPLYIEPSSPQETEANLDVGDKEQAPTKEWWRGLDYKELRERDPVAFGQCPMCSSKLYWGVCSEWLCRYGQ